ncbi:MAG: hypothetical protein Q8M15_03295 [Bacteroidota bacterium]|nr:hypothetical protein [Bacteroidota bacterium]
MRNYKNIYRCFKLLIFIGVLFFANKGILHAQIIIQPPILGNDVGQYQILELNLINNSGTEYNAFISYEINFGQTAPNKLETSGTTKKFKIPASGLLISVANIQNLLLPINPGIKASQPFTEYLIQNAKFPDGYYRICVKVFDEVTQSELGNVCYEFKIESLSSIFLVSPSNNEIVNNEFQLFSWTALTQLSNPQYELVLIEVLKGQSLIQAAKSNRAFYTQQSATNILQLSFASRTMTPDGIYLWYVRIMNGNNEIAKSELWSFRYQVSSPMDSIYGSDAKMYSAPMDSAINDAVVHPPELKFPKHNSSIKMQDMDSVVFSWAHERSAIKGSIIYEYRLFEVNESGDKEDSLIYTAKKKEELKLLLPKKFKYKEGKRYKWTVAATGNRKLKPCKKGCSSASYIFEIGHNPHTLQYYKMVNENGGNFVEVKDQINFTCCNSIDHHDGISLVLFSSNTDRVLIIDSICVKDSNEKLIHMGSFRFSLLLDDLKAEEPYILRVGNGTVYEYLRFRKANKVTNAREK